LDAVRRVPDAGVEQPQPAIVRARRLRYRRLVAD
jgi:hypothetical protein